MTLCVGYFKEMGGKKGRVKMEKRCVEVKTEMKHQGGKDPEGGIKKRKEVGNESPLSSIFQK